jgi:V/A-type H+-transporting ATPase subunit I
MLFTERMKKIELLILKTDADAVMRFLGFAGCMQLIAEGDAQRELSEDERVIAELKVRLSALARFLGMEASVPVEPVTEAPGRHELRSRSEAVLESARPLVEEESRLLQRKLELKQAAEELSVFAHVKVPFADLANLTYLTLRIGSVAQDRLAALAQRLSRRALFVPLNRPGHFIVVAPKKGRWALDSELSRAEFQAAKFPAASDGVPGDMLAAVMADIASTESALRALDERKKKAREENGRELAYLLTHLDLDSTIDTIKQGLVSTASVQKITGWIPLRLFATVTDGLDGLTQGRIALRTFDPEELPEVKAGKTKVPVSTPHGRVVRSFERMVFSYSIPLYGTIDPTPFVAVMFVLLFAIMFGDVGQGLVGLIIGLLINSGRVASFESYRRKSFGTAFAAAGLASMVSGFFYGSFFANEHFLEPASRFVTRLLVGRPIDHIISLQGFQKIILFFGVTIGVGAIINSIGLLINLVNTIRRRDWEAALLSKTGLAGALFFWYGLSIAIRILLGGHLAAIDFVALAIPLLALFLKDPLMRLAEGHRPLLSEGMFAFIMGGIAEILESAIYYVSNSVSFLRVAAFALAHTVLSTIIILMADMVGGAPGGIVFKLLVIVIGNSVIVILEGLIVSIQVVRLQYYEFFSKFFNESGEEFVPFNLLHREV